MLAVVVVLGGLVVASVGFLVSRLQESLDDVLRANADLMIESLEKERALESVRVSQAHLVDAARMELLGQLAGGIAHDVNNALTVVLAEAGMLEDTHRDASEVITEAVQHATTLTQQLLTMGRREVVQPRRCDAGALVDRAVKLARRTMPEDIKLVTSLATGVFVLADPSQIQQVVLNLTTNARDAMPKGGQLDVVLSGDGSVARLVIKDTGSGINEATLQRIFDPFFTTKAVGKGTGLGLWSVRDVVTQLGGTVACQSREQVGTTFTLEFPRVAAATGAEGQVLQAENANALDGLRILVVEDDIRVRAVAVRAMQRAGAHVVDAANAPQAIAFCERALEPFHLVWTDVVMPEGGAAPLLSWLVTNSPNTPIIVSSGYADDELIRREVALGRYRLVPKPFASTQVVSACVDELRARRA